MVPTLFFYQLGLVALLYVFLLLCWLWPTAAAAPRQPIAPSKPPRVVYLCAADKYYRRTHRPS